MPKVIIIGLDGATLDLMEPWMDAGKLPIFDRLRKQGSYGVLRSTIPPYSAPAWVSITTGVNPGKHGIYDFFRTDTFSKKLVSSKYRKAPAIWNYLTEFGKKCIVVNVPGSYPPERISGIMISGLLTPSEDSEYTYPSTLKQDLVTDKLGVFEFEQIAADDLPKNLAARYAPQKLVDTSNTATESHSTVTLNLLKKYPWDFAMVVFRGTDDVQHLLWGKEDLIFSCYQKADESVGKIWQAFPDAVILLVSDHGFGKPKKYLYVNNVLYNQGYLRTFSEPQRAWSTTLMSLYDRLSWFFYHFLPMKKLARSRLGQRLLFSGGGNSNIDFSTTKAVYQSVCSCGIRINQKDEQGNGVVASEDYEKLRDDLIGLFTELTDPETGERIVKKIYRWEDVYSKDAVNHPLDIIFEMEPGYSTHELLKPLNGAPSKAGQNNLLYLATPGFYDWVGDHRPEGVVFIAGPGVRSHQRISASVMDIVPTVLALMDLPLPDSLDGDVIPEVFVTAPEIRKIPKKAVPKLLSEGELQKIRELRSKI
ncbi:MAG TPA: alkaline phosphatase family protein [Candidatus Thermoplasmatota archaeon]|nr:alkaline phosphatase family protein [Candidatus Thermoplasmatota archaeon]